MITKLFNKNHEKNTTNEAKGREEKCPNCGKELYISFDWDTYLNEYVSSLQNYKKCKNGILFQCKRCETFWFLGNRQSQMESISKSYLNLVLEWDKRSLSPNDKILSKFSDIGATPPDIYGNGEEYIRIPCKCITKDEEIDFCIVSFQKSPPDYFQRENGNRIIFIDELVDIEESKYALNKEVRLATSLAYEVSMCFSPTCVVEPNGKVYILNGITDFFEDYEVIGKDIALPKHEIALNRDKSIYYDKSYYKKITWVIADWKDEYSYLRIHI